MQHLIEVADMMSSKISISGKMIFAKGHSAEAAVRLPPQCKLGLCRTGTKLSRFSWSTINGYRLLSVCLRYLSGRRLIFIFFQTERKKQMKLTKILSTMTAALLSLTMLASCGESDGADVKSAKSIADLKGAKIAAQAGTFHEQALNQIDGVKSSTYPEFTDLLIALKSGAIDGYVAEEPTALSVCGSNEELTYLHFENNKTGFTATAADVGIAFGFKQGSDLCEKVNGVLGTITEEQKKTLMEQIVTLSTGGKVDKFVLESETPAEPVGTLKVGMECAYSPYNWTDTKGDSLGAVPIASEGQEGLYANGYDVQVALYVANKLGMKLEIYAINWESLIPAVQSGTIDTIVAGMSPTAERKEEIDFSNTYYESNLVIIIKK